MAQLPQNGSNILNPGFTLATLHIVKAANGHKGVFVTHILVLGAIADVFAPLDSSLARTFFLPLRPSKMYKLTSAFLRSTGPVKWMKISRAEL